MASVHTVRSGDTLSALARQYNTTVEKLAQANNIRDVNRIQVGQQLTIPDSFDAGQPRQPTNQGDTFQSSGANTSVPRPADGIYDGRTPASGTTNDRAWIPLDAPLQGDPSNRNAATYADVIDQFAVGSNPRYTPRNGNTYCNIFAWDVTRAMGAEIPHWVDANGNPTGVGQGRELNANAGHLWLENHGSRFGWREVSAEEAQALANQGHPTVASWHNPGGIGHIAVVRPGEMTSRGPAIAQAGAQNFNDGHVMDAFGNRPVKYFVNDGGTVAPGQPQPAPAQPTPTPSTPAPSTPAPSTAAIPQMDLQRGMQGEAVRQLQEALVKTGYMTQAQMNTGPGTFGPQTEAALKKFQAANGVPNTGYYGPQTREAFGRVLGGAQQAPAPAPSAPAPAPSAPAPAPSAPAPAPSAPRFTVPQTDLQRGMQGEAVRQLQEALVKTGYMTQAQMNTGPGTFGPQTEAALKKFQAANGVPNTGYYGPQTREALTRIAGGTGGTGSTGGAAPVTGPSNGQGTSGGVTLQQLRAIMPNLSEARAQQMLPHLNAAMIEAGIDTPKRQAAFLAQLAHESGELRYMEEIASGAAYEGRRDLGNTQPGDGKRFKGRGPIQLTGRANYTAAGAALGLDLVNNPEQVATPEVGFRTTAWYWNSRGLNQFADSGDFRELTRRINGGYNGLADREAYYRRALSVLGA